MPGMHQQHRNRRQSGRDRIGWIFGYGKPRNVSINNWTNVGGRIENTTHSVNISQETVLYDQRFSNGVAPPWFPSTTWTVSGVDTASYPSPTIQPTQWIDETAVNASN